MKRKELAAFTDVFDNPDDFNFLGVNTAKYFYDLSLSREIALRDAPVSKPGLFKNEFLNSPFSAVISFLKLFYLAATKRGKVIFYGNPGRLIKEGDTYLDIYNYQIVRDIGPDNTLIFQDRRDSVKKKVYHPDFIIDDMSPLLAIIEAFLKITNKTAIEKFWEKVGRKMEALGISEGESISKLFKFTSRLIFLKFLLRITQPKSALVICHYAKHAFIAACKSLNIPVFELMHGQILPSHHYYNNPRVQPKFIDAFRQWSLPDKIAVYGDFWKKTLVDGTFFSENAIVVLGYYLKIPRFKTGSYKEKQKKIILIASDGIVQSYFLDYIKFLKIKLNTDDHKIIIKLHPSEDGQIYQDVIDNQLIYLEQTDIHQLFNEADILISAYSTVLFEATLYKIKRYSLFIPKYQIFCEDILNTGVAEKLENDQLPSDQIVNVIDKKYFIDTYNFDKLKSILKSNKTSEI